MSEAMPDGAGRGDPIAAGSQIVPYEQLIGMIEHELELAAAGRLEPLAAAIEQRHAFASGLPAVPPPDAAALLQRASLLHQRAMFEALRCKEALVGSLSQIERVRHAARGYAPAPRHRYSTSA